MSKMKFLTTLLILSASISGCSNYEFRDQSIARHYRVPANEKQFPMDLTDLLSFKSSNQKDNARNYIKNLKFTISSEVIEIIYKENNLLPEDIAYRLVPVLTENSYQLQIHYGPNALIDTDAFNELQAFLNIFKNDTYKYDYSLMELFYNAKNNHLPALHTLAKIRQQVFLISPEKFNYNEKTGFHQRHSGKYQEWQEIRNQFALLEKKEKINIKAKEDIRRLTMNKLDAAVDDQQLRTLIAKNDRKGVANLLRSYLPWEHMAPFEEQFWLTQLDIIENPAELAKRVLVLRGIDDDAIQVAHNAGVKLTKEEAIQEQKIFLMSTILTKNQGSWNRRLRSLTAMNDKFIGVDDFHNTSEYSRAARMTNMFYKHSLNPEGSPFLSFTPNFQVASQFGEERLSAYLLDPRAIHLNYASAFKFEIEFLMPLMTFPDELVMVVDYNLHEEAKSLPTNKRGELAYKLISDSVKEKFIKIYGKNEAQATYDKMIADSHAYFSIFNKNQIHQKMGVNFDAINLPVIGEIYLDPSKKPKSKTPGCLGLVQDFF